MKNKTRIEWIDALKFLGIWAIYIGHFGEFGGRAYQFVFSYHVPLFFFAAGMINNLSREKKYSNYIRSKIKGI